MNGGHEPGGAAGAVRPAPEVPGDHVHDVVDLDGGRIVSMPVPRPPSPASRLRRLADAGMRAGAGATVTRTHRLTPRRPFQTGPGGWLDAFDGAYSTGPGTDEIWWRLPPAFATEFMPGVNFIFQGAGAGPRLLSLTYRAWPYAGLTGTVVIDIGAKRTEIPITAPVARTTDVAFTHPGGDVDARVFFRAGLIDFVWKAVALARRT